MIITPRLLPAVIALLVAACAAPGGGPVMTVAATADPETTLLAHIYAAGLRYYGTAARVEAAEDVIVALDTAKAGVAPGFTGTLLARLDPQSTARSAPGVYRAMVAALPEGIAAADYAVAAEDKPALAVEQRTAQRWGGRDLEALVRNCAGLRVGAVTGTQTPDVVGDCYLGPVREYGSAASLFDELRNGSLTAAWTSTADPAVPTDVVVLADRKPALIPAHNVVGLYRRNEMDAMQLRAVNELAGVLDTASLTEMLRKVRSGTDPQSVAEDWLAANPLGR